MLSRWLISWLLGRRVQGKEIIDKHYSVLGAWTQTFIPKLRPALTFASLTQAEETWAGVIQEDHGSSSISPKEFGFTYLRSGDAMGPVVRNKQYSTMDQTLKGTCCY